MSEKTDEAIFWLTKAVSKASDIAQVKVEYIETVLDALTAANARNAAQAADIARLRAQIAELRSMTLPYPYQDVTVGDGYDATKRRDAALAKESEHG